MELNNENLKFWQNGEVFIGQKGVDTTTKVAELFYWQNGEPVMDIFKGGRTNSYFLIFY